MNNENNQKGITVKIYIERQNHLAVCKLHPSHLWFFSACFSEIEKLLNIGRVVKNGECFSADLNISNIKSLGRYIFYKKEEKDEKGK